jgi:ribosomal protein S18 acetylase RimI-like enzyme
MTGITIRRAEAADLALLDAALRALSADLGDHHRATPEGLRTAGFGPAPAFRAVIALAGAEAVGAALFSPLYSTTRGFPGAYVSDLWVAQAARGAGLGPRLLATVRDEARALWGAGFLRLAVYGENPRAVAFYERLGFAPRAGEVGMILEGTALDTIGGDS